MSLAVTNVVWLSVAVIGTALVIACLFVVARGMASGRAWHDLRVQVQTLRQQHHRRLAALDATAPPPPRRRSAPVVEEAAPAEAVEVGEPVAATEAGDPAGAIEVAPAVAA